MGNHFKLLLLGLVLLVGCQEEAAVGPDADDVPSPTTLQLAIRPAGNPAATPTYYTWRDLDGPGGNPPVADTIDLYVEDQLSVEVFVLDDNATPTSNLTPWVESNASDLQLFFRFDCTNSTFDNCMNELGLIYTYADLDGAGRYIGLAGELGVPPGEDASGSSFKTDHGPGEAFGMRVVLQYQPAPNGKATAPIPSGSILLGNTLLDATFPVRHNDNPR